MSNGRGGSVFRKTAPTLAWATYAWFASEAERLIVFNSPSPPIIGG